MKPSSFAVIWACVLFSVPPGDAGTSDGGQGVLFETMVVNPTYIAYHGIQNIAELITPGWDDNWVRGYTKVEPLSVKTKNIARLATGRSGKEAPIHILVDASLLDLPVSPVPWNPRTIGAPLERIPLFEVIRAECMRLNLRMKLTDDGILILPAKESL